MTIQWVIVQNSWTKKPIGAVGFIGDEIATIVAFHDDKDANEDGNVTWTEKAFSMFTMQGRALAQVASHAYADPEILIRDPSIGHWRGSLLTRFAQGLMVEGIYKAWFATSIGFASGAIAGALTQNAIKSFVIKKSLEKTVDAAYKQAMRR